LDLTDLFAFPKPDDASKSIIIMDMHPSMGINPPGPTTTEPFAPEAIYELMIDTNEDLVADVAYRIRFSPSANGAMTATLRRVEGPDAAGTGDGGQVIIDGAPVSMGPEAQVAEDGDYRFFAGWRSDPFFFDAGGALNQFQFTGEDFFADKNICSIALEVPNSALGPTNALWHRVLVQADGAGWTQVDRGARPSQSVFFAPGEEKALYHSGEPAQDERFISSFAHVLEQVGRYTPEEAQRTAAILLPDVIRYDPTQAADFPRNGRALTDDVADAFLTIFTNAQVTEDKVGPHSDFLSDFPYLGPPHNASTAGDGYSAPTA